MEAKMPMILASRLRNILIPISLINRVVLPPVIIDASAAILLGIGEKSAISTGINIPETIKE